MKIIRCRSFLKDLKGMKRCNHNTKIKKLNQVIEYIKTKQLHRLTRNKHIIDSVLPDCKECHVEWDLVLIYKYEEQNLILIRIGKHDDVYKKTWANRSNWLKHLEEKRWE